MIGIVIQARMGSTRLPGKILKQIGNRNLLEHIFFRLSYLKNNVQTVLATTISTKDDIVQEFCIKNNITCFRGSEQNVLERYFLCAKKFGFKHIVRLTADNPFTDIEELDNLINYHINKKADYSHSLPDLPVGVGAEIFTFTALEKSFLNSNKPHHFEHVDEYILENKSEFDIISLPIPKSKNRPDIVLTVDTEEDYKRACYIVKHSKNKYISTEEAIALCMQYV